MERSQSADHAGFREVELVLAVADLAGFTRASRKTSALDIAAFFEGHYASCSRAVASAGGRVVKFMGDACFAVFPRDRCAEAVEAFVELSQRESASVAKLGMEFGANIHVGMVVEGEVGTLPDRRYDVFGAAVNYVFRMGGGPGLRVSEPVYRSLPNAARGAWRKEKPPAVYHR